MSPFNEIDMKDSQQCWCGMSNIQKRAIHSIYYYHFKNKNKNIRDLDFFTGEWIKKRLGTTLNKYAGWDIDIAIDPWGTSWNGGTTFTTTNPEYEYYNKLEKLNSIPLIFTEKIDNTIIKDPYKKYTSQDGFASFSISTDEMPFYGDLTVSAEFQGVSAEITKHISFDESRGYRYSALAHAVGSIGYEILKEIKDKTRYEISATETTTGYAITTDWWGYPFTSTYSYKYFWEWDEKNNEFMDTPLFYEFYSSFPDVLKKRVAYMYIDKTTHDWNIKFKGDAKINNYTPRNDYNLYLISDRPFKPTDWGIAGINYDYVYLSGKNLPLSGGTLNSLSDENINYTTNIGKYYYVKSYFDNL
jgi:hypothetical protein